jgi:ADP-ribose pyrophosphatase YjhB (NUDIX family)
VLPDIPRQRLGGFLKAALGFSADVIVSSMTMARLNLNNRKSRNVNMSETMRETGVIPAIGVGGLVFNGDTVLLICRNQAPASGQWSLPGGKLEAGESLIAACAREIREETGISAEVKQIVAVVERRVENFHYVIIDFLADLALGTDSQPVAASDAGEARWVAVRELAHYDLVEGLEEIIRRAYRYRRGDEVFGLCDIGRHGADFILP